jgi:hypothetical protein
LSAILSANKASLIGWLQAIWKVNEYISFSCR